MIAEMAPSTLYEAKIAPPLSIYFAPSGLYIYLCFVKSKGKLQLMNVRVIIAADDSACVLVFESGSYGRSDLILDIAKQLEVL